MIQIGNSLAKDIFVGNKRVYEVVANGELKYWYGGWYKYDQPFFIDTNFLKSTRRDSSDAIVLPNQNVKGLVYYWAGLGLNPKYRIRKYSQDVGISVQGSGDSLFPFQINIRLSSTKGASYKCTVYPQSGGAYFFNFREGSKFIVEVTNNTGGKLNLEEISSQGITSSDIKIESNRLIVDTSLLEESVDINAWGNYQSVLYLIENS